MSEDRPTVAQVKAAARVLDSFGRYHSWWPKDVADYDDMDPIGKDEFEAIVEKMLIAAARAR